MRAFVSLLLLSAPGLLCAGLANAAEPGLQAGKPVCSHYEGTTGTPVKPADSRAKPTSTNTAAGPAATATSGGGLRTLGGDGSELRPNNAPRWQAFLPGMFR